MNKAEIMKTLNNQYPHLVSEFGIKRIGLFGSYAQGTEKESSDIDLIVEFNKPIGLRFIELSEYLENILKQSVDILTLGGIKGIRHKEIADNIMKDIIYVAGN